MSHIRRIAALAVPLILAAQPAPADTPPGRIMVPHDDLDLSRQTGAQAILWRLRTAVSRACGEQFPAHDPAVRSTYR
jgi:UrcA family protein